MGRVNARKIKITYTVPDFDVKTQELVERIIRDIQDVEAMTVEYDKDDVHFHVQFTKKVNLKSAERLQITFRSQMYTPILESTKVIPEKDYKTLSLIINALGDRDDDVFLDVLRKDPAYNISRRLGISEYHIYSAIVCKLYEPGEMQQNEVLKNVMVKINALPYLTLDTKQSIDESVKAMDGRQVTEVIEIFKRIR